MIRKMTYQDSKEALIKEVKRFVDKNPQSKCTFYQGQRIIKQGENSTECFLITQGAVRILVREGKSESEKEIISREPGDLIGEMAFLQRNQRRTASVEVVTDKASFIRITRSDIFSMMHENPQLGDALERLQHLATTRSKETEQVLKGEIIIEQRMMSVLFADIHNFTLLGESIWEEHITHIPHLFLTVFGIYCEPK